jgi:amino acid adenylation domain-containing protein/non-ribosomal peptide synthase protein (TIGR01720 family)
MSDLLKRLENLSPEKRELVLKKLQTQTRISSTDTVRQFPSIEPIPRDRAIPLSFAQQRLWFLNELEGANASYNMAAAIRLSGPLQVAALERAIAEIVQRHDVLRTNFKTVNGIAIQSIAPTSTVTLPVVDLQALTPEEQSAEVQRLASVEAEKPFDLANDSLVRITLLMLRKEEHMLLVTIHHIVSDGWSIGIFFREVATLYEAFSTGKPSPLSALPIQYADFAHWQRQWLQGEVLENRLNYWKQQLAGAPPLLSIPTDRPRPKVQTFRGGIEYFQIDADLTRKLKTLSRQSHATLFMTLLAAFASLLSRYSNQSDIVVGSPIANRNRSEIESLIGFFVNTLLLRIDLNGNPDFWELLNRTRQVALDAYAHQDVPFEKLVDELQPERNLSYNPLFQVMFVLQNTPDVKLELPGLTITLENEDVAAKFDLTLSIEETEQELIGSWEYNTDLFDAATIKRMVGHFQTLLEAIVANPQQRVSELPLLTATERHTLLVEWNNTFAEYPFDKCIHQLFEAQVEQTPDAVALVFQDQQLTYDELNSRANQLAHHLRSLGVGPDGLVGLCLERSLEMVVGVLGILKAGGAYVPLDPAYPSERLAFMLEDTQVEVLLTQQSLVEKLPSHQARVLCLDTDSETLTQQSEDNPKSEVMPDHLAYVMYTSGSTGRPKGVSVIHRGIVRLVKQTNYASFSPEEVFLQLAPISFDASTFEIWGSLLNGARLVVMPPVTPSLQELGQALEQYQVTTLWLTAGLFHLMVDEQIEGLKGVRQLLAGGDVLSVGHVKKLLQEIKGLRLINGYGPTENTTFTCCYPITEPSLVGNSVPIGRPIANTQVYLLDEALQPVPVGVAGELYIGGDGLARGYLNRPDLTSQRFIPNPFSDKKGDRLYKTGDLARYLSDGNIEFLGRLDNQVKIRGFRIELGEIEAVLGQHQAVQEVVVMVREDIPGNKRLVAYLVLNQLAAPSMQELQHFVKQHLPEYMVPSAFVLLENLPLTPNGKVDRDALPAPDTSRSELAEALVAARTPVEEMLARIWADILGLEQVGIHDNFFELGGDSILSIQIVARANQAGLKLTPKQLFGHQTIAELAAVVGTNSVFQAEQGLVTGEVLLTPIQRWFFEHDLPEPYHWNQAMLLEVPATLDLALLSKLVQQLLVHHDALRLRFMPSASGWQQVNALPDEAVPCTRVDLSALSKVEQVPAIEATAAKLQASLNLSEGPLVRVALFDRGPNQPSRLLFVIHHLVVDGVSWRILLEDLQTCYQQLSRGLAMKLPPKTTSFQDWAQRLSEYAQSTLLEQELEYWLAQSRFEVAPLPVDYPQGKDANIAASASNVVVSLSSAETRTLLQEVPQAYNTQINDVLLTALAQVFSQWLGTRYILVDLEGHGREEILPGVDLSRTVGWFTTVFPVLLDLRQTDHPGPALKSVKEQLRRIPNRGIGYGLLRYVKGDAEITEKLRSLPQAEVSFNYLGQFDQVLSPDLMFQIAKESSGPEHSRLGRRRHLLEVNALVAGGQLQLDWTYSSNLHQRATIESLAQGFLTALRSSLIAHCQSPEAGGYTPSDFPLTQMSQDALDTAFTSIEFEEG